MGMFKDDDTRKSYHNFIKAYMSLNIKFQLFEEYAMQYALSFQRNILSKRFRNFEFSNIGEIHKFYIDYVYKNSVIKLDEYMVNFLDYCFLNLKEDRNYYIHEYYYDFDRCFFCDEDNRIHYVKESLDNEFRKIDELTKRYSDNINTFKTILKIDTLKTCREYKLSASTKSIVIDMDRRYTLLSLYALFFYTLNRYCYIENNLYHLFKYIQKNKKCFDDNFVKNMSILSLGQYGKILKEKTKDARVYLAIQDYIKNYDEFFKKIDEINIDRNFMLHGLFPKYFVNKDSNDVIISEEEIKIACYKAWQAAIDLDNYLDNMLTKYEIRLKSFGYD